MNKTKFRTNLDTPKRRIQALMTQPENSICADCHHKDPRWASSNLGVFLCMDCSANHRGLGTHISFVRSCTLDLWTEEQVDFMNQIGNKISNEYYEANLPQNFQRPTSTNQVELSNFIRKKYELKFWADQSSSPPNQKNQNKRVIPPADQFSQKNQVQAKFNRVKSDQANSNQMNTIQSNTNQMKTVQSNTNQMNAVPEITNQMKTVQSNANQMRTVQSNTNQMNTVPEITNQMNVVQSNTNQMNAAQPNTKQTSRTRSNTHVTMRSQIVDPFDLWFKSEQKLPEPVSKQPEPDLMAELGGYDVQRKTTRENPPKTNINEDWFSILN